MAEGYELRSAEPRDGEALTSLFNAVFCSHASGPPGGSPRSVEHWRWKYVDNGVGSHSTVAVSNNGKGILGHVGGLPLPTWCRGEIRSTNQSVDNMTHPESRAGLRRVGLFAKMVNHWVETYFGPDRDFLAWGFPSVENFRIGQKFSKYFLVRTVNALVHEHPDRVGDAPAELTIRPVDRFSEDVEPLWRRCARDIEFGVVRNLRYLNWRYADHPVNSYDLFETRDGTGTLRGIFVTREGRLADTSLLLMDWLVPEDDDDTMRAQLAHCSKSADAAGLGSVSAWFPEGLSWFRRLQLEGYLVRPTDQILVARSWDRWVTIPDLRRGLYATVGDMDFY